MAMTAVWCIATYYLVNHPLLASKIRHIGDTILPFVLIGLGIYILVESFVFWYVIFTAISEMIKLKCQPKSIKYVIIGCGLFIQQQLILWNLRRLELVLVQPTIHYNHAMICLLASFDTKWKKAIKFTLQTISSLKVYILYQHPRNSI